MDENTRRATGLFFHRKGRPNVLGASLRRLMGKEKRVTDVWWADGADGRRLANDRGI
ncbi:hypothetical protein MKY25_09725 [Geobacillus sp. FSL W8-0032]|uniref:Uncharacterized protein n=1 Tax=Geobacillus subterraneus TaxID=129338 RepID=A0A679FME1_9BACL|nr:MULTISPECIES: hypothetical protein [Geobacillus]KYD30953.1 hypothetical protein B4113_2803 [Geobacillus sp. B4113_201601]BBW96119.1 hypothetical protein GsuE55_09520 [Geobacillus subterraneus]